MRDFTSEKGDAGVSDVFARPGSRYLVIDIGGNDHDQLTFVASTCTFLPKMLVS